MSDYYDMPSAGPDYEPCPDCGGEDCPRCDPRDDNDCGASGGHPVIDSDTNHRLLTVELASSSLLARMEAVERRLGIAT